MTKQRLAVTAISLALLGSGCSGSSTLVLQLTDAPPDLAAMSAALVTLDDIDVHLAGSGSNQTKRDEPDEDEGGWVTLAREPQTYDLLKLQNDVVAAMGEFALPEGKITQIRLHLDPAGKNEIQLKDGQVCPLDMRNVPAEGVKINHPFKALDLEDGHRTSVVVDFDLKESVSQEATCTFRLNPVIKLKSSKMD
jgi:hypothetical protein